MKRIFKSQIVLLLMELAAIVCGYGYWVQGLYAPYTVMVVGAGFFLYPLAQSFDTHEKRSQEYAGERKP